MSRLRWPLAFVATFALGSTAGVVVGMPALGTREVERLRATVSLLQQQVETLEARLRARESAVSRVQPGAAEPDVLRGTEITAGGRPPGRRVAADGGLERSAPRSSGVATRTLPDTTGLRTGSRTVGATPPTVELALDRFYQYLRTTSQGDGRERWRRARELAEELKGMGDTAAQALMRVLASGGDSEERRAAARLLGTLQAPQSLPVLQDILEREDDVLLRRAAAVGMRRLQTPESLPIMERMVLNPDEDRFVRLSAAYGLAEAGRLLGVTGLVQIFEETTADGRGRDIAFRALASLNDQRALPFMRQLVLSPVEPGYRLQAIRYLTAQGDQQALTALQFVMQSPNEQASIRDAAALAYAALGGK